jgi:hypothetical protein
MNNTSVKCDTQDTLANIILAIPCKFSVNLLLLAAAPLPA